jgi:hypothetical protein
MAQCKTEKRSYCKRHCDLHAALITGANVNGPHLALGKTRGDGKGTYSSVLTNDRLGTVDFFGDDGVDAGTVGALIKARAAADWGASEHSTEMVSRPARARAA